MDVLQGQDDRRGQRQLAQHLEDRHERAGALGVPRPTATSSGGSSMAERPRPRSSCSASAPRASAIGRSGIAASRRSAHWPTAARAASRAQA